MADRPWGFWTESKLGMLSAYLRAFNIASKRARSTVYLDLFAGQDTNINKHTGLPLDGSLRRALSTDPPFTVLRGSNSVRIEQQVFSRRTGRRHRAEIFSSIPVMCISPYGPP